MNLTEVSERDLSEGLAGAKGGNKGGRHARQASAESRVACLGRTMKSMSSGGSSWTAGQASCDLHGGR